ncbi:PepSY domain-containing protein [Aurantivibrio plasticivorans]
MTQRLATKPFARIQRYALAFAFALATMSLCVPASAVITTYENRQTVIQKAGFLTPKRQAASNAADAAKIAQARHGGKVVKVSRVETNRGVQYKVKLLLKDGRVKTVTVNGR